MNRNKILLANNNVNIIEDKDIVTQYTYMGSTDILPSFTPTDYKYTVSDITNSDGTTTRTIYSVGSVYPTKCVLSSRYITSIDYYKLSEIEKIDLSQAFSSCYAVTKINLSMLNTSNCASFSEMCKDCREVISLDLSNFNMAKAVLLSGMFGGCSKLQTVNTNGWGELPNVTRVHYMFSGCNSLIKIIGSDSWMLPSVTNASNLFANCNSLPTLDLSNLSMPNCINMKYMCNNCKGLTQLKLNRLAIKSNCNVSSMLANIQPSCVITVPSNFGKTEADCGFTGTFNII